MGLVVEPMIDDMVQCKMPDGQPPAAASETLTLHLRADGVYLSGMLARPISADQWKRIVAIIGEGQRPSP